MSHRTGFGSPAARRACLATLALGLVGQPAVHGQAAAEAPAAAAEAAPAAERIKLTTSDGVQLAAWFYAPPAPEAAKDAASEKRSPVVILLHDLGGSHESVQPLALDLRERGIAVVAVDLRGHGASTTAGERTLDAKSLKKPDFDKMVMTGGGRVRDQAELRGDVEAVRNWIREQADKRSLDAGTLILVGAGAGAAVAAHWTGLDAKWPELASGPQGGEVRGLVFVSPAWTTRGFSISPALTAAPLNKALPVLVIGGTQDADAVKIYEQLKRQRPDAWSEKRAGQQAPTQAAKLGADDRPSLYLRQFDTGLSGDRLAAYVPKDGRGGHPAAIIDGFLGAVTAEAP